MVKVTDSAITSLHDQIQATTTHETLSLSATDKSNIVGTIVVDSQLFNVTAKIIGGEGDGGGGGTGRPAQVFTIICAINSSNGVQVDNEWQYNIPHPFNGLEYTVHVIDAVTNQQQHTDIIKHTDHAIIITAQQLLQCYDVTFFGFVA